MIKLLAAFIIAVTAIQSAGNPPADDPDRIPSLFEQSAYGQQIRLDSGCGTPESLVEYAKRTKDGPIAPNLLPPGCFALRGEAVGTIVAIRPSGHKTATTETYYVLAQLSEQFYVGTTVVEDTTKRPMA